MTPEQRLALAVLALAAHDARSGNASLRWAARRWLREADAEMRFWCHVAGLPVEEVQRRTLPAQPRRQYVAARRRERPTFGQGTLFDCVTQDG